MKKASAKQKCADTSASGISPTGLKILEYLENQGGMSAVGIFGCNRTSTVKTLRRLETRGLIACVDPPERIKSFSRRQGYVPTCGIWRLSSSSLMEEKIRSCSFCSFTALYSEFPDDSICFENIMACAPCLETDKTNDFRALLDEEKAAYPKRFTDRTLMEK